MPVDDEEFVPQLDILKLWDHVVSENGPIIVSFGVESLKLTM